MTEIELTNFKKLYQNILTNNPLQYVTGETSFMGLKFKTDKRALIPRIDTEVLVETVISIAEKYFTEEKHISILDIGTGSGAISVALAKLIPKSKITSIDISADAISLANENGILNKVEFQINFLQKDILTEGVNEKFHLVVSNPPYISLDEYQNLSESIKNFEPRNSLTDEKDGLTFYRRFAEVGKNWLFENGFCILEHAYNQQEDICEIFSDWEIVNKFKDYNKLPRGIVAKT